MTTGDDLNRRVSDHLEGRTWTTSLPEAETLARSISRRARRRRIAPAVAAASVSVAVIALVPVLFGMPGGTGPDPAHSGSHVVEPGDVPSCGDVMTGESLPGVAGLHVTPQTVPADGPGLVSYNADLVNDTGERIKGTLSPPQSVVTKDGVVVASFVGGRLVGLVADVAPGDSISLDGTLSLLDCQTPDTTTGGAGKTPMAIPNVSLPPGRYVVRSWVTLTRDDGTQLTFLSDLWPLEIR